MNSSIILIDRGVSLNEHKQIIAKLNRGAKIVNISEELGEGIQPEWVLELDSIISPLEKKKINYKCMEWINNQSKDYNDILKTMLPYFNLYEYHKFRLYFEIRNSYYLAQIIKNIQNQFNTGVELYSNNTSFKFYLNENNVIQYRENRKTGKNNSYNRIIIRRIFSGLFVSVINFRKLFHKKNLLIDFVIRQNVLSLSGEYKMRHPKLDYLFQIAKNNSLFLNEVRLNKQKKYKLNDYYWKNHTGGTRVFGEMILLRYLLNPFNWIQVCKLSGQLKRHKRKVPTGKGYKQHIKKSIFSKRRINLFFAIRYLSYRRFFRKHPNIRTITTTDEHGPFARSILDAAKAEGVKTIGIQHGAIHELHPAYRYSKEEVKAGVLPDYTLVWGKYWKDFLIKYGNYPAESLHITGQIRADIIPWLQKHGRKMITDQKLVVFASQPQRDPALRRKAAEDVFEACKNLENTHLAVKLHPNEYEDEDYYINIATQAGNDNYSIEKDVDLYELINSCEVLITCFSTVGTETVYFKKPLIVLDHLQQDVQGYIHNGVGVEATNAPELKSALRDFLFRDRQINQMAYESFIENYAYCIDGKAAQRTLDFIQSL